MPVEELGVTPQHVGAIARLRAAGDISAQSADALFEAMRGTDDDPKDVAKRMGLLTVTDAGALEAWVDETLADPANGATVADVRAGKMAAVGRLIGGVMQRSGGQADAKSVRAMILDKLGAG